MFKKTLHILCCLSLLSCSENDGTPIYARRPPIELSADLCNTRTAVSGTMLPPSYCIYSSAFFRSNTAPETDGNYFTAVPFRYEDGIWATCPAIYWPVGGTLDFLSIACKEGKLDVEKCAAWNEPDCSKGLEVNLEDGCCLDSEILFAAANGRNCDGGSIPMQFRHAQSWLQFVICCESETLLIDSIVLEKVYTGGRLRVTNNLYLDAGWSFRGHLKTNAAVPGSEGLVPLAGTPAVCNILVPEQDACDIVVHYRAKTSSSDGWSSAKASVFRHKAGENPWFYGERNIFHIEFSFSEMSLNATVREWTEQSEDITVNQQNKATNYQTI